MSSSELLEYVTRTVAVGGRLELLDYAFELGMAVIRSSGFPVDWFERVHEALASPQIAGHQDAWKLLKMLGDNWDAMSQEQKELSRRRALAIQTGRPTGYFGPRRRRRESTRHVRSMLSGWCGPDFARRTIGAR